MDMPPPVACATWSNAGRFGLGPSDPKPVTVHHALRLFAEATGRPAPREHDPLNLATALMRAPGLQRFTHTTRAFLDHLKTDVIYDDRNTRELLAGTGITCPDLASYVDVMVARAQPD